MASRCEHGGALVELGVRAGATRIAYEEFIGLQSVDVLELTGMLALSFL